MKYSKKDKKDKIKNIYEVSNPLLIKLYTPKPNVNTANVNHSIFIS